jgi:two-component system, OmpR family, phosphate regulon sensor histidine kinase PhoR
MWWLIVLVTLVVIGAIVFATRRKWIAPWYEIDQLVRQIGRGEQPRTFLVAGSKEAQRVGVALEEILIRQRELDKQIAKRESGTQAIFSAMQDGLLVVDSDRRFVLANETFRNLFSLPGVSKGTPLLEVVRDPVLDRAVADTLDKATPSRSELLLNGSQIELNAVPTKNESGEISGAVVLFHDISDLKRADQIRRDFVANVSHELRTPLSILRGYIETMLDDPKMPRAETARILEVMEEHSKRLGLLANDLLTLAQLESGQSTLELSEIDLLLFFNELVRDWNKKFAAKNLKAVVDVTDDCPVVRADEARLREVFDNLLDNALKYSNKNGEVRLQAERRGNEIVLSVSDNGIGISGEDLPRIFERFYRADKARSRELGGTGLGLSIVKHIAQLHGGRVEAESELGKGSTIRVVLPAVTQS